MVNSRAYVQEHRGSIRYWLYRNGAFLVLSSSTLIPSRFYRSCQSGPTQDKDVVSSLKGPVRLVISCPRGVPDKDSRSKNPRFEACTQQIFERYIDRVEGELNSPHCVEVENLPRNGLGVIL